MPRRATLSATLCVIFSVLYALPLVAQQSSSANQTEDVLVKDVLRAILTELRSVRQAMDRALVIQTQLLLWSEQVKIAYQTVITKNERLEGVRGQAALVHAEVLQATRTAETLEGQINQALDLDQKENLDRQLKEQKSLITENQQREAELRNDEARLQRELEDAQYKMEQSTAKLETITNQIQQLSIKSSSSQ